MGFLLASEQTVGLALVVLALVVLLVVPGIVYPSEGASAIAVPLVSASPVPIVSTEPSVSAMVSPGVEGGVLVPARQVGVGEAASDGFSFCGDNVCDASESCSSCVKDCGCSGAEFCGSAGVCQLKELAGDGICTAKEKSEGVCIDCGCSEGSLCNYYSNSCIARVSLSKSKLDEIVKSYLAENPSYSLSSVSDSYFGEDAVKLVSFVCSKDYYCMVDLLVDQNGKIIKTLETT